MTDVSQATVNGQQILEARQLVVWIDADLCTGDGLCVEIVPPVFDMGDDGLAYVKQDGVALGHPDGEPEPLADIPHELRRDVVDAASECPGECIFVEIKGEFGAPNIPVPIEVAIEAFGL